MRQKLPGSIPSVARRIDSHVARARRYVEEGDGEAALTHLRIAAEAWGRFSEQVRVAVEQGDPGARRLHRLRERDGERLLSLQDMIAENFISSPSTERAGVMRRLWTRLRHGRRA